MSICTQIFGTVVKSTALLTILMLVASLSFLPRTAHAATVVSFTSSGSWTAPAGVTSVWVLAVAGGGGGGSGASQHGGGGGGGAGGFIENASFAVTPGNSYTVTVGTGGAGGVCSVGGLGSTGGDSYFGAMRAFGGGGGSSGYSDNAISQPTSGGSGGGAYGPSNCAIAGGASIQTSNNGGTGYGNAGGSVGCQTDSASGGGGASAAGTRGGPGGNGRASSVSGSSVTYAGGGGGAGGFYNGADTTGKAGGSGGGGAGTDWGSATNGVNGTANRGGGGGGSGGTCSNTGGVGGSGIVILSYTPPSSSRNLTVNKAVSVTGNVTVVSNLTKGSGTFVIDHPLDPGNKLLYHSFVESPDALNEYTGTTVIGKNGEATVRLPDYFEALNKDYQYFIRPIDMPMGNLYVKQEVKNNSFVIAGGTPGGEVSWLVTGVRHDPYILAHPIIPEVEKGPDQLVDKGEYLFSGNAPQCLTLASCLWGVLVRWL